MLKTLFIKDQAGARWLKFEDPVDTLIAKAPAEVPALLGDLQHRVDHDTLIAAGFLTYEAAAGIDNALTTLPPGRLPPACFGLFRRFNALAYLPSAELKDPSPLSWQLSTPRQSYIENIHRIKEQIQLGNTYQVNYTIRQSAVGVRESWPLFVAVAADAPYAAYIELDDIAIISASPELFFLLDNQNISCRPMKGTAMRGMTLAEDEAIANALHRSEKNRAENIMITDMMRNDLGRIAIPGSVTVSSACRVEKFPTVWQMTSTVEGKTNAPINEILQALFPCASVTGAPKASSMEIIAQLEDSPREIYTGTIGYCLPGRRAQFNVAIRTAWVDTRTHQATYGTGGGIVWDSEPGDEYTECLTKSRVLHATAAGREFQLLETMLWKSAGGFFLLQYHLDRMQVSARYFDFSFDRNAVEDFLAKWQPPTTLDCYRVRLLLDRAGNYRIDEALPVQDSANLPQRIALARHAVDTGNPFLFHKTTNRRVYEDALRNAGSVDDVLLWNSAGFITETTRANVVVRLHGQWVTPPVSAGLLAGTYRQWMLENTHLVERNISVDQLGDIEEISLINSVRGQCCARMHGADA